MKYVSRFAGIVLLCASVHPSHVYGQQPEPTRTSAAGGASLNSDHAPRRPRIGIALGGGSARGFAHIGVLRWFHEHHVPIDVVAGTSMGGLVGGAFASGMTPAELAAMIDDTDWDQMFGASPYRYKSIRRKQDARDYPARLELHLRRGVDLPSALNDGQQVDLLLAGIGARYAGLPSFDALPTPFRAVAFDLQSYRRVVLGRGSLPEAMRATMSIPGVFPPVGDSGEVLVDGGVVDNVPVDAVRAMGADVIIAVDVQPERDSLPVAFSAFSAINRTVGASMRANTRAAVERADIVIRPRLQGYGSLDWRRADEIAEVGYRGAEAMADALLPLAVDDATWAAYERARRERRRSATPRIAALRIVGADPSDERTIRRAVERYAGRPLDPAGVARAIEGLGGLDRYETITWDLAPRGDVFDLVVLAREQADAPPILMSTINVRNQTRDDFSFQVAARFLAYDVPFAHSELRVDGALGTDPSFGAELRQNVPRSGLFAALGGEAAWTRTNFTDDDVTIAQYVERRVFGQFDVGIAPRNSLELRVGARLSHLDIERRIGGPELPELSGAQSELIFRGVFDNQNHPIVPSAGQRVVATSRYLLDAPDSDDPLIARSNDGLTQAEIEGSSFWSWNERARRVFVVAGAGSSFGTTPLITDQFVLGLPFRLDAYAPGERRGDNYGALTAGYLQRIARLPDFLGGPVLAGGWLEGGSAFDRWDDASVVVQAGAGLITETLVGPFMLSYSAGAGEHRFFLGFGRLFR